jgi:hypothetical protein
VNDAAAAVGETNARTQPPCACLEGLRDDLSAGLRANVCVRNCGAWINPKREEAVRQQDDRSWGCGAIMPGVRQRQPVGRANDQACVAH